MWHLLLLTNVGCYGRWRLLVFRVKPARELQDYAFQLNSHWTEVCAMHCSRRTDLAPVQTPPFWKRFFVRRPEILGWLHCCQFGYTMVPNGSNISLDVAKKVCQHLPSAETPSLLWWALPNQLKAITVKNRVPGGREICCLSLECRNPSWPPSLQVCPMDSDPKVQH